MTQGGNEVLTTVTGSEHNGEALRSGSRAEALVGRSFLALSAASLIIALTAADSAPSIDAGRPSLAAEAPVSLPVITTPKIELTPTGRPSLDRSVQSPAAINDQVKAQASQPLSLTYVSKKTGLTKQIPLVGMDCGMPGSEGGTVCEQGAYGTDLDPPTWNSVFYLNEDNRVLAAHSSENPQRTQLAGQWFDSVRPNDSVTIQTTNGPFEYVADSLVQCSGSDKPAGVTRKGTAELSSIFKELPDTYRILVTCDVSDNNDGNVVRILRPKNTAEVPLHC